MTPQVLNDSAKAIFRQFRSTIASVEWRIQFWGPFLQHHLKEYLSKAGSRDVFTAIFAAYNVPADSNDIWLWSLPHDVFRMTTDDLEDHRRQFFEQTMNLGYVRAYNALEMFLFQAVVLTYFPKHITATGKNATKVGDGLVKKAFRENEDLGHLDTKNNRHLITFLKYKSPDFASFVGRAVRTDLKTTWEQFFEMISILRNVNTHHVSLLTKDVLNELQGCSKDLFSRYFTWTEGADSMLILEPKAGDPFINFIGLIKEFAVNSVKFIFEEDDLSFLGLYQC